MNQALQGKHIVITGAGQGLGQTVALQVAKMGAAPLLLSRNEESLKNTKKIIEDSGGKAYYFLCDIRDHQNVEETVAKILKKFPVDVLINNAGIWTEDALEYQKPELRRTTLETNVLGHIEMTETLLPHFLERGSGHILNVISVAAFGDSPSSDNKDWKTYGASKWAMRGYTNALLAKLKDTPIRVTGFYPGGFTTSLFQKAGTDDSTNEPWMMRVEDVAEALIFSLSRPKDVQVETIVLTKKERV